MRESLELYNNQRESASSPFVAHRTRSGYGSGFSVTFGRMALNEHGQAWGNKVLALACPVDALNPVDVGDEWILKPRLCQKEEFDRWLDLVPRPWKDHIQNGNTDSNTETFMMPTRVGGLFRIYCRIQNLYFVLCDRVLTHEEIVRKCSELI